MNTAPEISWQTPAAWPDLGDRAVHVWVAEFDQWRSSVAKALETLSPDERQRAASYRFQDRRECSIITRSLLRRLLAGYCGVEPRAIQFDYGSHGKPRLRDPSHALRFNASHSNSVAVFAFTRAGEVGVDVEMVRSSNPAPLEIAGRYFSAGELDQLLALPDAERVDGFFRCWTRKEAFLKARGDGVFGGLETFEVSLAQDDARLLRAQKPFDPQLWWMAALPEISRHVGAVAVQARECRASCWRVTSEILAHDNL